MMTLKLNRCFGSHMVLEQGVLVNVWGQARPQATIKVSFQNKKFMGQAKEDGTFLLKIGPFFVDQGSELIVCTDEKKIVLKDVAVGEVWLCGGQSNMEFPMGYDRELKREEQALPQNIRYFDYPEVAYEGEIHGADYHHFGFWRKATLHDLNYFTAVGYYFAKRLSQSLKNVPIGLLACNWGGSLVSCWMSREGLHQAHADNIWINFQKKIEGLNIEQYKSDFKKRASNFRTTVFENQVQNWIMTNVSMAEIDRRLAKEGKKREKWVPEPIGPYFEWRPCGLYHTMLLHVAPFTVKGVLWYQGESDANYALQYKDQLQVMIKEWRKLFQNENLPFLIVQLPPFIHLFGDWGNNWPIIRNAQQWIVDHVPNTALIVTTDSGMKWNIHPVYKRKIGTRLALQALNKVYDIDLPCEAPRLQTASLNKKARELTLVFANCYQGLKLLNNQEYVDGLALIQGGIYFDHLPVKRLKGNMIVLDLTGFPLQGELTISLAEKDYYCVNLVNSANIPARPAIMQVS